MKNGSDIEYDIDTAEKFRTGFFDTYSGIRDVMDEMGRQFKEEGKRVFSTVTGRKRWFTIFDPKKGVRKGLILNSRVQGSAADILKLCIYMIKVFVYRLYPGTRIVLQVHDELVLTAPKEVSEEVALLVKYIMEFPWVPLSVPVLSGVKICKTWADKDDDNVPEVGTQYAKIDGVARLFDKNNWSEFVQADKAKKIQEKGACAILSPSQVTFCKSKMPVSNFTL